MKRMRKRVELTEERGVMISLVLFQWDKAMIRRISVFETNFSMSLGKKALVAKKSTTRHFGNRSVPKMSIFAARICNDVTAGGTSSSVFSQRDDQKKAGAVTK